MTDENRNRKKVLLVSYWFPPRGMGGVQRALKTAKYLNKHGWEVHVVTVPEKHEQNTIDKSLMKETEGLHIYRLSSFYSTQFYLSFTKKFREFIKKVRRILFPFDIYFDWVLYSYTTITKIVRKYGINNIILTSPPHSIYLLAILIKLKFKGIKVIIDLRDPWTFLQNYRKVNAFSIMDPYWEKKCYSLCDYITVVSKSLKRELVEKFQLTENKIKIIENGFDPEDFSEYKYKPDNQSILNICYVGGLRGYGEEDIIWKALLEFSKKYDKNFKKICFTIIGDIRKLKILNKYKNIKSYLDIIGFINKKNLQFKISKCDCLFIHALSSDNTKYQITSKVYQYLYFGLPILAITPKNDLYDLIRNYRNIYICGRNDIKCIINSLRFLYKMKLKNKIIRLKHRNISYYTRENLTYKFEELLNE